MLIAFAHERGRDRAESYRGCTAPWSGRPAGEASGVSLGRFDEAMLSYAQTGPHQG